MVAKLKILVVEDTPILQKAIQYILQNHFDIHIVGDGKQAIETPLDAYKAIVMDIGLPQINGIEATKLIRSKSNYGRVIPILAYTTHDNSVKSECLAAGMDMFLTKPAPATQLINTLWQLIETSSRYAC